jgi:pSer/pThr/pTyr-binding forkhead associated (FHA) protein
VYRVYRLGTDNVGDKTCISRVHANVRYYSENGNLTVENLGMNGTFVNDDELRPKDYRLLNIGDTISKSIATKQRCP